MLTSRSNRSPSPVVFGSKFAQVRDIFARGGGGGGAPATAAYPSAPIRASLPSLSAIPSLEQTRSPKTVTVLNAVQEYQRQHINNHQSNLKRFSQFHNGVVANLNRSATNGGLRSRNTGLNNNANKFPVKQNLPAYVTSSPKQQPKPITRVI